MREEAERSQSEVLKDPQTIQIGTGGNPLTISEFSNLLKRHIEPAFFRVILQGEISGYTRHASGHHYFSLKDQDSLLECVCWRAVACRLSEGFKEGASVVCCGRVVIYPARSRYQLVVEEMHLQGQGALLQQLEARKAALAAEGLFSAERKQPLPAWPTRIGILTSPTGAVIQDMLHRFQERMPCTLILYPVVVQGASAVADILGGLRYFQALTPPIDLVIIARGGGSVEDLWPFQDEALVRAVAAFPIPVISAVGHETDTTLLDYAADVRAPTPTAAVELAVKVREEVLADLRGYHGRLTAIFSQYLNHNTLILKTVSQKFWFMQDWWQVKMQRLDDWWDRLESSLETRLQREHHRVLIAGAGLGGGPGGEIAFYQERLQTTIHRLQAEAERCVQQRILHVQQYERFLQQTSFQRTLERGFNLAYDADHRMISSAEKASACAELRLLFADGWVTVTPRRTIQ